MTLLKHTPGPWRSTEVTRGDDYFPVIKSGYRIGEFKFRPTVETTIGFMETGISQPTNVATVLPGRPDDEIAANLQLVSAAPSLLDALIELVGEQPGSREKARQAIRLAITKEEYQVLTLTKNGEVDDPDPSPFSSPDVTAAFNELMVLYDPDKDDDR